MAENNNKKVVRHSSTEHAEEGEGWLISYADLMTLLVGFFVILLSFSTVDEKKFEEVQKSVSEEFGGKIDAPMAEISQKIQNSIDASGLGDQIKIVTSQSGLEISFLGTVFFDSGSADLKPEAVAIMDKIIPIILAEPEKFDVIVEGHTDDVPISNSEYFRSNWELSSLRACRVLDFFLDGEFDKSRVTAIGYADSRPLVPNRDSNGKPIDNNRIKNRRVVINLKKEKQQSL